MMRMLALQIAESWPSFHCRIIGNELWQPIFQTPLLFFQEIRYVDSRMTTARLPRHPFLVTKASKYADQLTIAGIIDFGWQNNIITLF